MAIRMNREQAAAMGITVPKRRSKYGNVATVVDGIRFASAKEARRYSELCLLRKSGDVAWFIMQVPFRLPGGTIYRADFVVVRDGGQDIGLDITIEDVKSEGTRTQAYKIKKREVEKHYGITITEI